MGLGVEEEDARPVGKPPSQQHGDCGEPRQTDPLTPSFSNPPLPTPAPSEA